MKRLRVPAQYLPIFCRELHQLVRTGIPLAEGLTMLREDETDPDTRSWLEALCRSTEEGLPLASALRETGAFPAYMTDMVSLAEETGRLEDVLLSLQRHYDRQLRMAADIRGAVAVPVTLFAVMVAVVILLVTQVLPVFDRVFAQLGVRMGAVATGMMNAGAVLAKAGTGIAVVLVAAAAAALVVALVPALREKFAAGFRQAVTAEDQSTVAADHSEGESIPARHRLYPGLPAHQGQLHGFFLHTVQPVQHPLDKFLLAARFILPEDGFGQLAHDGIGDALAGVRLLGGLPLIV